MKKQDETTKMRNRETNSRRILRRGRVFLPVAVGVGIVAACSTPASSTHSASGEGSVAVAAPVASTARTAIASGFRGMARPRFDVGRVDGSTPLSALSFRFRPSAAQVADRDALATAQQDPRSPSFRKWLTPEQYAARFGATPTALAETKAWLAAQGFQVSRVSRAGTQISFAGTASQVETAFGSELHHYEVNGRRHFALAAPATLPDAIAQHVVALHGADDFGMHTPRHKLTPMPEYTKYDAGPPVSERHAIAPEDFAKIYGVPNMFSGSATPLNGEGISIAIVGESNYNDVDVATFRSLFGLPAPIVDSYLVPGSGKAVYDSDAMAEAELDLEWSGAVAPAATIKYVYTGDDQSAGGAFGAMTYALDESIAPIMSASFSACEQGSDATLVQELLEFQAQANLEGITFVAASGDTGPAGCDPNNGEAAATEGEWVGFPASMPGVTAVGGTGVSNADANWSHANDTSRGSVILPFPTDTAWNDTFEDPTAPSIGATGGGPSSLFAKPVWQTGTGVPTANHRYVPDIALSAGGNAVPYLVYFGYTVAGDGANEDAALPTGLYGFGGTSAGTPSFAGILAILNQALVAKKVIATPGLGNINPQIYALANSTSTADIVTDITSGDNCVPCTAATCPAATADCPTGEFGFKATVGYDQTTGLGTINAQNLITAWSDLLPTTTTLVVTPSPATTGASVTLTATVTSTATTPTMGGTVTFYDQIGDSLGSVVAIATNPGTAVTTTTALPPGVDVIFAAYSGDTHFIGSFTKASANVDGDGNVTLGGGGTPVLVVDAGLDAAAFDAAPPPLQDNDAGPGDPIDASLPLDASNVDEAGIQDAGITPVTQIDASTIFDAGPPTNSNNNSSSSGCGCVVAGAPSPTQTGGALGGMLFGIVALVRRRRGRR